MTRRTHARFRRRLLAATALGGLAAAAPFSVQAQTVDGRRTEPLSVTAVGDATVRVEVLPGGSIISTSAPDVPAIGTAAETGTTEVILGGPVTGSAGVRSTSTGGTVTIRGPGAVKADTGEGISVAPTISNNSPALTAIYGVGPIEAANSTGILVNATGLFYGQTSGFGGNIAIGVNPSDDSDAAAQAARLSRAISGKKGIEAVTNGAGTIRIATGPGGTITATDGVGINAESRNGDITVDAGADVSSLRGAIYAEATGAGNVTITSSARLSGVSSPSQEYFAVKAESNGGNVSVGTEAKPLTGVTDGIFASTTGRGDVSVNTGRGGGVFNATGAGISTSAVHGNTTITVADAVRGSTNGITALATGSFGTVNIVTGAESAVTGTGSYDGATFASGIGIYAKAVSGATVTVEGSVTSASGTAIKVDTQFGSAVVRVLKGASVTGPMALDVYHADSSGVVRIENAGMIAGGITAGEGSRTLTNTGTIALAAGQGAVVDVTNEAGGVVSGTGTVDSITAKAGSVIRPGDRGPGGSTGRLEVSYSLYMEPGSRLEVRAPVAGAEDGQTDSLSVLGPTQLNGGTIFLQAPIDATRRWKAGVAYTVISVPVFVPIAAPAASSLFAPAASGEATNLSADTDLLLLKPGALVKSGRTITVTLSPRPASELDALFAKPGPRALAKAVARARQAETIAPRGQALLEGLDNLTVAGFDQLDGQGTTGGQAAALSGSGLFSSNTLTQTLVAGGLTGGGAPSTGGSNTPAFAAAEPLQTAALKAATPKDAKGLDKPAPAASTWRLWATGLGAQSTTEARAASPRITGNDWGLAAGFDYVLDPQLVAGVSLGGTSSRFSVGSGATTGTTEGLHTSLYGIATFDELYVAGSLGYGRLETRARRTVSAFGAPELYAGKYATDAFTGQTELGYRIPWEAFTITPFAGLQASLLHQHAYAESTETAGGVAALSFEAQDTWSVPGQLGLQVERGFALDGGWMLTTQARAAWVHEFSPERTARPSFVALPGSSFSVDGIAPVEDFARLTAGLSVANDTGASLFASLTSDLSASSRTYAVQGGLKMEW